MVSSKDKTQKDIILKNKINPDYHEVDPRVFLILDDCLCDLASNKLVIKRIFMSGRHSQFLHGIEEEILTSLLDF